MLSRQIDNETIYEIIKKSYKEAGVSTGLIDSAAMYEYASLPPWTILLYINSYCYLAINRGKFRGVNLDDFTHRQIALFDIKDGIKYRWSLKEVYGDLYDKVAKHYIDFIGQYIYNSYGNGPYNVLEKHISAIKILHMLETGYEGGMFAGTYLPSNNMTEKERLESDALKREITYTIDHIDEVSINIRHQLFMELLNNEAVKRLDDVIFFLIKNYKTLCGDERVNELFDIKDGDPSEDEIKMHRIA